MRTRRHWVESDPIVSKGRPSGVEKTSLRIVISQTISPGRTDWLDKMGDVVGRAFFGGVVFWPVKSSLLQQQHKVFCVGLSFLTGLFGFNQHSCVRPSWERKEYSFPKKCISYEVGRGTVCLLYKPK